MIVKFEREDLLYGVSLAQRIAPSKHPQVAVSGLLLKTIDSQTVEIIGTDLELSLQVRIRANVQEHGQIVLPARFLSDLIRRLPDGPIYLEMSADSFTVKLTGSQIKMDLRGIDPMDFPLPQAMPSDKSWSVPRNVLKQAINKVSYAISQDEARPVMTGLLLKLGPEGNRVLGMDGFRLAEYNLEIPPQDDNFECIIPNSCIKELEKLIDLSDTPITMRFTPNHMSVQIERVTLQTRLIEGQYPFKSAQELMRKTPTSHIKINRKNLIDSIERSLLITRDDTRGSSVVRMEFEEESLIISAQSPEVGQLREEIPVEKNGHDITIGFNGRFLLDILRNLETDYVRFDLSGSLAAGIVYSLGDEKFTGFLSPIRLS
ncbi:MAG: DNA polymerase III subunit beta [Firmicutes bacterium]|jgi:DNA polymerase-3 subunit beta|nr:DNA polymerase III subunit beta [Bacillota bacterium]